MIQKVILDYLKTEIRDVPIYLEKPTNPPAEYVYVEVSGIRNENINLYSCLVTVQNYAETMYKTSLLNERTQDVMEALSKHNEITHCSLNSGGVLNDTTTKRYRYQSVYNLTYYRR